jgi:cell division protein FtsB
MGRSHQRSARMQARGSQARASGGWALPSIPLIGFLLGKRPLAAALFSVLCLALFAAVVFPGVQDYYLQMRTNAQLEAEYQAVLQRNEELQQLVSTLQTDEGIEQLAHESLGWVREGEQSVSVMANGSSDIGSGTTVDSSSIPSGSVPAPTTWYSPALDALFGYEG